MDNTGWVKIHRSIFNNPWMRNANMLGTWAYILLNVAYQPEDVVFEGKRITLQPGQGLFKMRQMAKELGIPRSTLHRTIMLFKNETQIETQTTPRNTLITVVNWSKYQVVGTQNGTQVGHKWDTSGTQNDFLPINNKRIKEVKNKEKINKKEKPPKHQYGEYKNVLLSDEELEKLKDEFPTDWQERIERVSGYCASRGKSYTNYLATIRNWARKENKETVNRPIRRNDAQAGYQRTLELLGIGDEIYGDGTGQS